eukprot:5535349-Pleurochrysis_carterae.AAC.1
MHARRALKGRERCVSRIAKSVIEQEQVARRKSGRRQPRGKAESQEGRKTLWRRYTSRRAAARRSLQEDKPESQKVQTHRKRQQKQAV